MLLLCQAIGSLWPTGWVLEVLESLLADPLLEESESVCSLEYPVGLQAVKLSMTCLFFIRTSPRRSLLSQIGFYVKLGKFWAKGFCGILRYCGINNFACLRLFNSAKTRYPLYIRRVVPQFFAIFAKTNKRFMLSRKPSVFLVYLVFRKYSSAENTTSRQDIKYKIEQDYGV